jgi:hypothetical protein
MKLSTRILVGSLASLLLATPLLAAAPKMESILDVPHEAFHPSASNPNVFYYIAPKVDLRQYQSVLVAPLVILQQGAGDDWNALVTDSEDSAPSFFQSHLTTALQDKGLRVVTQPGPGVLRLQVAVTHVRQDHPGFSVTDVFPAKMVFNLARYALGKSPYIVKVSTMAELTDSRSGKLLAGGVGMRQDDKSGVQPLSLSDLQTFMAGWSVQVADYMAKFMAAHPESPLSASAPMVTAPK